MVCYGYGFDGWVFVEFFDYLFGLVCGVWRIACVVMQVSVNQCFIFVLWWFAIVWVWLLMWLFFLC